MLKQQETSRSFRWTALGGVLTLALAGFSVKAWGQLPSPASNKSAAETNSQGSKSPGTDRDIHQQANPERDELAVLEVRLEAQRALLGIAEARREQAKRWEAHYEQLFRDRKVTEDRLLAAKDDVLMIEAHVAGERAELNVAEIRLGQARRRVANGEPATGVGERRLAEVEQRLAGAERKIDQLQHEIGRLRRDVPRETSGAR